MTAPAEFLDTMRAHGLEPPALLEPGKLYRLPGAGKGRGNGAGWCKLFDDGTGGVFGDWSGDLSGTWQATRAKRYTDAEREAFKRRVESARREREKEELKRRVAAATKAAAIWGAATPCESHPYLTRKGVEACGARVDTDGRLILPRRDAAGEIRSLQFIAADGDKRYQPGGEVRGTYLGIKGEPAGLLYVCEGFATGASIRAATGGRVAVAFDCGNLEAVALALRGKYPDTRIVLCADDDSATPGNPGVTKATAAARAVGGLVALPDFGDNRPDGMTDFNDLHQSHGLDAVRACLEAASAPGDDLPDNKVSTRADGKVTAMPDGDVTGMLDADTDEPAPAPKPHFLQTEYGVEYVGVDKDGNPTPPLWLCAPLDVVAKTRDAKSGEWGRLLEWRDADGVRHQWAMPLELLQGDGADVRRELARQGLAIAPSRRARDQLAAYLQVWPVSDRARCVERLGWCGGVYVTPGESIGEAGERVVFQNAHALEPAWAATGTAAGWRDSVARLAAGNTRLVFALAVAFAAPLAELAGEDSGGFHLRGGSSSGKTTALKAAASVWGDPATYPRLWRATANGLEGLAALHNDGLLILDELSQIDPKEAGESAYLLANGQGKARAGRTGTARQSARWRLLFLSAGEESLSGLMARAGRRTNAGQEIRLADLEADAGAGMGAFEALHDLPTPAAFALAVKDASAREHGAAGVAFIRAVVADRAKLADFLADGIRQFVAEHAAPDAAGQVLRVARRFALVAVAGELATHYGLTGWESGESIRAASKCFAAWLEGFGGTGNREERAALAQIRAFFEAHGASRFEPLNAPGEVRTINRAGFWREGVGEREYLVLPETFKRELCAGYDVKAVIRALLERGWVQAGGDGRATQKIRDAGRCYVFTAALWEGEL